MPKKKKPRGYKCGCGVVHPFHAWVFAHWYTPIKHQCRECNRINFICAGRVDRTEFVNAEDLAAAIRALEPIQHGKEEGK